MRAFQPLRPSFIDSEAECCEWAREAGAQALRVDPKGRGDAPSLAALVRRLV